MAAVVPLGANDSIDGTLLTAGEVDQFQVMLPDNGRLTALVHTGTALHTRLSLLGPDGQLLIQSDGQTPLDSDDLIAQHLLKGTYSVTVTGLGSGLGHYTLSTQFEPATPPNEPVQADYPTNYPFALTPRFGAVGDFNGDGVPDLVTADVNTGDVSVFLGLGDGTFQKARNLTVGALPISVAVGDFNGDGKLDLAVANQGSNDVSILLGRGDGTFEPERRVRGGNDASFMVAADVNGDGKLDLVIGSLSNFTKNYISVLLGNGDGTFQPELPSEAGGKVPARLALGDFNGDGHVDIAVADFGSNNISILLGRGDGTFQLEKGNPLGNTNLDAPFGIVAGDFNHDGRLDLAVTNSGSSVSTSAGHAGDVPNFTEADPGSGSENVAILLGNGDGTFTDAGQYATGTTPLIVTAGDFNHDGNLDLAVANRQSNDVSVLLGNGDGTFQEQKRYRAGLQPWGILAADFNGDGNLDLAAINIQSHDVSILLGLGDGTFQPDLTDPRHGGTNPLGIVTGDFNRDGIPDLAAVSYSEGDIFVYQGRGDGTFGNRVRYSVGSTPAQIVAADFNGDGILDLATANCNSADVSILLGRGDGTFQTEKRFAASTSGEWIVMGDFNGDGKTDLITGGQFGAGVSLLLGNGDGTFQAPKIFAQGYAVAGAAVGDFDGDGKLDLAVTNLFSPDPKQDVLIFLGNGNGTFRPPIQVPAGIGPLGIVAGDFNHDGNTDLAVTNFGIATKKGDQGAGGAGVPGKFAPGSVSILLGNGDGTFHAGDLLASGGGPDSIVAGDFNGDGNIDLAVTNSLGTDISVFTGRGDGTFQTARSFPVGDEATPRRGLITGDFNSDGKTDLAVTELFPNDVSVLLGSGDGAFAKPLRFGVGLGPVALTTGDFNEDGRLDVAGVNPTTNQVSVSLGRGDSTLQDPVSFGVGSGPVALVQGDFNRDGRADLATANFASNDVSVLLGLGDGTFQQEPTVPVGTNPTALVTADFNGDGTADLAVANAGSNDISILLGLGHGTFQDQIRLPAGDLPQALVTGDFNGDGIPDLAVANYRSQDVWVYLGRGDGTFRDPLRLALPASPIALVTGYFNGDRHLDLAVAYYRSGEVSVLLGQGDGTFRAQAPFATGTNPTYMVTGDFNGDGIPDLAVADSISSSSYLFQGKGDGTFQPLGTREAGDSPGALVADDFNSDGRMDLAFTGQSSGNVLVLQGKGDSNFTPGGALSSPLQATPLISDWNGDGLADVAVVNRDGEILLRLSRPGNPGVFQPPVIVNPAPLPPARDLAVVSTPHGQRMAALDAKSASISFYAHRPDGTFSWSAGPEVPGLLPVALAAADLNGDGLTDLAVADTAGNVFVYMQDALSGFGLEPSYSLAVGLNPSALALVDVTGDGRPDIVVTSRYSGDVSVLCNAAVAPFTSALRFRAGTGLYSLNQTDKSTGALAVSSRQAPAGLVAGRFDSGDPIDLVVTDSGANRFALLRGDGEGGFLNPESPRSFATGPDPTVVVQGRFTAGPNLDLAILDEATGEISIFLGDGHGGFMLSSTVSAGNLPTGLAVADIDGDGKLDLLVGNDYGDLLMLLGIGDGTFRSYQRAGRNVALAVADLTGKGQDDFIFADQALDQVSVSYGGAPPAVFQDRHNGLLAPTAVKLADLNGDGIPDLIVANGGGNSILVYPGLPGGGFGPEVRGGKGFFTGTNPVGITVAYLNDDLVPDPTGRSLTDPTPDLVVANEGSNDVTILLGHGQGQNWTLEPGPRLKAFGSGPVSTALRPVTDPKGGPPTQDLLIANSQSNTVTLLPGRGGDFFDIKPQSVQTFPTGPDPLQVVVGPFVKPGEIDLLTVNAGSNDLTFFPNFGTGRSIDSGGSMPLAAVAADLNHDGIMDLLVANNGDGAISLLLGSASGPTLAKVFSSADVKHPTDVALGDDPSVFYVSQEGEETAARFTLDLGLGVIASPSPPGTPARQIATLLPLVDAAPATVATLLTVADEREAALTDSIAALESTLTIGIIVAAVNSGENYEPDAQALLLDDALPELRQAVDANPGLPGFVIGLEEALQRTGLELRQKLFEAGKPQRPVDDVGALLREAISIPQALIASAGSAARQWLTDSIFDVAQSVHGLLGSAAATFGLRDVPLPGSLWQDAADALLQSGRSTMQAVHDALRSLLSAEGSEAAPGGHGQIDIRYFERTEWGENELQIAELRLRIEERDDDSGAKSPICNRQSAILEDTEALTVPLIAALFASGAWQAIAPGWQSDRQRTGLGRRALRAASPG
jgi:hypothetical protein